MNRILSIFIAEFMILLLVACLNTEVKAFTLSNEEPSHNQGHGLILSDMQVKITSMGHTAIFRLYDTSAVKEFYDQLPLQLDLTKFRDAQWMFYPPEKLNVTAREAYHDGKKGELSYYAPWGDVVMFYPRFGSAAGLYELGHAITGGEYIREMSGTIRIEKGGAR